MKYHTYVTKPVRISAEVATKSQTIDTLEGKAKCNVGDYIITGIKGERWPVAPAIFKAKYKPISGNVYEARPVTIKAYRTNKPLSLKTSAGILKADAGDYIIQWGDKPEYPCKPDIFKAKYKRLKEASNSNKELSFMPYEVQAELERQRTIAFSFDFTSVTNQDLFQYAPFAAKVKPLTNYTNQQRKNLIEQFLEVLAFEVEQSLGMDNVYELFTHTHRIYSDGALFRFSIVWNIMFFNKEEIFSAPYFQGLVDAAIAKIEAHKATQECKECIAATIIKDSMAQYFRDYHIPFVKAVMSDDNYIKTVLGSWKEEWSAGRKSSKVYSDEWGAVNYGDPGYQPDKKKRYPLNTEKHIRAAWAYIHMPRNASKYTKWQLDQIKSRISKAWYNKLGTKPVVA